MTKSIAEWQSLLPNDKVFAEWQSLYQNVINLIANFICRMISFQTIQISYSIFNYAQKWENVILTDNFASARIWSIVLGMI
jgi:hypothetical protein